MPSEIRRTVALPRRLAAVTAMAQLAEMPHVIPKRLQDVWTFLGANKVSSTCHNVVVYLDSRVAGEETLFDMLLGVEVHEELPPSEGVRAVDTPAGPVATTTHWGPYDQLAEVHATLRRWLADQHLEPAGPSWEVYGDWSDDPSRLRTDVYYLLRE